MGKHSKLYEWHVLGIRQNPPTYLFRIILMCSCSSPELDKRTFFNRESSFMDRTLLFYPKAPISDGTHSLQGIHWWATDVLLKFCKSVLIKKMNSYIYLGWPEVEYIFSKYNFLGELFLYCCFDSASTRWHRWAISKYCSSSYKLVLSVLGGIKK